ncbi:D-alanine--D-alanine ligase family protein [Bacillus mexicanus]|uniref:D-alanine--D-alanine ligase family protein n=1 Tax=Bacillus mexicanus TaxID=2834415 RepID=UPI003D1B135C
MKRKLAVIFGGASGEHEVSIKSAFSILTNINYDLFEAKPFYIDKNNNWYEQSTLYAPPKVDTQIIVIHSTTFNPFELKSKVDVVFPITHGPFGEDGHFQALLEIANIPYVGCDVLSSAVGMDKGVMKDLFAANNIPQGKYSCYYETEYYNSKEGILNEIEQNFGYPCFVKPANLGSSVGISKANNRRELYNAVSVAFNHDNKIVIEEFIKAREIEIGVLGNGPYTLSVVGEIATSADFYDYDAKYHSTNQNKLMIPAELSEDVVVRVKELASKVAKVINVKGLSRIDFFYDENNQKVMCNEINTLPGFTKHSMYPMLFNEIGIPYTDLITKLIDLAYENHKNKKRYNFSIDSNVFSTKEL